MNKLRLGDARTLMLEVEDGSVDLVFTDPLYSLMTDYAWLGEQAYRVLKDDRPVLVWASKKHVDKVKLLFEQSGFKWVWTLDYIVKAKPSRLNHYHLFTWSTPCLWFNKGKFKPHKWIPDTYLSDSLPDGQHKWNKNMGVLLYWMESFSQEKQIVLDPFCGSGSTLIAAKRLNRRYIGFEREEATYNQAVERLEQVDSLLFDTVSIQIF